MGVLNDSTHVLKQIQKHPEDEMQILETLDMVWGCHHAICLPDGRRVRWSYEPPFGGIILVVVCWFKKCILN
jgi:hypothetical protein